MMYPDIGRRMNSIRDRREADQLVYLINNRRRLALQSTTPNGSAHHNSIARQYLFDLIRLTRYKSAIQPVNEAY